MNTDSVFNELRKRIKDSDVSQNAMANTLGVQQASISKFLAGKTGLSAETFLQLLFFVGGDVRFDKDTVTNGQCLAELNEARRHIAGLQHRIVELEAENHVQERMLDKLIGTQEPLLTKKTSA